MGTLYIDAWARSRVDFAVEARPTGEKKGGTENYKRKKRGKKEAMSREIKKSNEQGVKKSHE